MFENLKEVIIVKVSYEEVMRKRRQQARRDGFNFVFLLGFIAVLVVLFFFFVLTDVFGFN
jgi:predicted nucleic acid-binding Zn ribbon protein